jgi:hypothetical protein
MKSGQYPPAFTSEGVVAVDLVEQLQTAAAAVIAAERPTIERQPEQIRSIVLELELDRSGRIGEAECYVQRRVSVSQALGLKG